MDELIQSGEAPRSSHPNDLTAVFVLCYCYRELATLTAGEKRRQVLMHSAAAWRSSATSFTRREEQKDVAAANL